MRTLLRTARLARSWIGGSRRFRALADDGMAPLPVLFYHRVADYSPTPVTMPTKVFARQVTYLRRHFQVIGLEQAQTLLQSQSVDRRYAAITFDDGYADNNHFALPLLARLRLPCTYFVSTANVDQGTPFPHDLEMGLELTPNTIDDLRHWSRQGIEIGLHTHSHFDFSQPHDAAVIDREIRASHRMLSDWIGTPVRYFAFPYGLSQHLSESVIDTVRSLGMSGFCSAFGAYNLPQQDPFHLRRIHGDVEMTRFWNWLLFDSQKIDAALTSIHSPSSSADADRTHISHLIQCPENVT